MGLEYSTRPELNQWETKNHAANIKMWLHDLVDGVIVPSIVSLENIFKAIDSYFGITGLGGIDFKATMAYNWTSTHDHDFNELQNDVESLDSRVDALEASSGGLIGEVRMWPAVSAPSKWMLCQGQAISRSTYAALFAVLGETYGTGNGSTTFNLPDFRGRAPVGAGQGSGLTYRALADSIGEEKHVLTSGENASHTHSGPSHTHAMAHNHTGPSHKHTMGLGWGTTPGADSIGFFRRAGGYDWVPDTDMAGTGNTGASSAVNTGSGGTGNTGASGSGTAHNNIQPSLCINFIIYSGV